MQKKKHTKQILSVVLAVVLAFAPIFFAGCNFDPDDSGDSGNSGNSTITTNFKIGDYLDAVKVSYSISGLSEDTQDSDFQEYSNQIISLTQMLAVDTMMGLMTQYGVRETINNSYDVQIANSELSKNINFGTIPYSNSTKTISFNGQEYSYAKEATYNDSFLGKYDSSDKRTKEYWQFYSSDTEQPNIIGYRELLGVDDVENTNGKLLFTIDKDKKNTNLNKLTYAILAIVDKFDNVSESDFDVKYAEFKREYDTLASSSSTDFEAECKKLSYNVKHSGLYANSLESRAFKQFILDRVIGEKLVSADNKLFQVYKLQSNGVYAYVEPDSNEKFRGETFYYNQYATEDSTKTDISQYINSQNNRFPTWEELNQKLNLIYQGNTEQGIAGTGVKLWQDIDNDDAGIEFDEDNIKNVVKVQRIDISGNSTFVNYPKYRALIGFRNYDYTVEKVIDNVLTETENKIKVNGTTIDADTSYPVIANVFSKNYSYKKVEVKGVSNDNSTSCQLPKQAYKSVLLSMKDRSNASGVKYNSLGTIYLLLESSTGVKVNVSMYARYYRKGSGFAYFGNETNKSTFYQFPNASGEVDGPYGISYSGGEIKEGCLFELEFEDMFKNAQFKNGDSYVDNTQTFDYTYQTEDKEQKTVSVYEVKPFPSDYAQISNNASHATIYTGKDYKTKPIYDAQDLLGSTGSLYAYSENNLSEVQGDCEFVELVFVTNNNNPFTFGFTGFIPQTELYN